MEGLGVGIRSWLRQDWTQDERKRMVLMAMTWLGMLVSVREECKPPQASKLRKETLRPTPPDGKQTRSEPVPNFISAPTETSDFALRTADARDLG